MQTKFILPCLLSTLFFLNSFSPSAQNRKTIETTTDILMFITPVAGFAGSLAIGDYQGTKQIIFSGAMNMAMTYALKYVIRKERPDHSDHHAFPSSHTSVSFQGASFIQRRYGWKFGLPAYLLSAYVGWGRTYAKKHDWWDIIGGAAIGTAVRTAQNSTSRTGTDAGLGAEPAGAAGAGHPERTATGVAVS